MFEVPFPILSLLYCQGKYSLECQNQNGCSQIPVPWIPLFINNFIDSYNAMERKHGSWKNCFNGVDERKYFKLCKRSLYFPPLIFITNKWRGVTVNGLGKGIYANTKVGSTKELSISCIYEASSILDGKKFRKFIVLCVQLNFPRNSISM